MSLEYLTTTEAADFLREGRTKFMSRIYTGQLEEGKHYKRTGRKILVRKVSLIEALESGLLNNEGNNNGEYVSKTRDIIRGCLQKWQTSQSVNGAA